MESAIRPKILFIFNPRSGNHSIDWEKEIGEYFKPLHYSIEIHVLKDDCCAAEINEKIASYDPDQVVAVGGDGTVTLVGGCLLEKNIQLGILPAGSANGLAKELGISLIPAEALHTVISGVGKKIHVIMINGRLSIHLSDIGFNARMIEKFQTENTRGIWGYFKATLPILRNILFINPLMKVSITIDERTIRTKTAMIVIANATRYGSGAVINPNGNLEDELFEVIVIKQISIIEIFKMLVTHTSFNPRKTEILRTRTLHIKLSKKMHFQVDGEYLGKVDEVKAYLIPAALEIRVPSPVQYHSLFSDQMFPKL
ncbi:diacylglycerol kinase family lipid kinase [Kaistella sp. G5-32]|uniref:Diacylglycerol kinase family lipid kinase n=1 Tax=Kaistella gelatinilytica TaxID=2787636 RepID=A0ABS0F8Z9_9FLAO|nr:diacylglycerol kinase family protein [Kaistella gelatinilytica]MBF8456179.1 diacylglycerol kinase family lipid kinase [Kaistella gelatinilytica]